MSAIQLNKLVVPCGDVVDQTTTGVVDAFGNIEGNPSFYSTFLVDIFGNRGPKPATGPWEIQKGAVEDVGTDQSRNSLNYATAITGYAAENTTGYVDGVISGAGAWTLQSSPQTIGGISYPGFGLLIATANNTHSTTTMQAGTHLQLGQDLNATTGAIRDVTLAANAILDIYGANTTRFNKVFVVTNNAGGTVNWKGPDVCGQGILGNSTATFTNNAGGVVNIEDCTWSLGVGLAGAGVINVLDGGTFFNNGITHVTSSNQFNINGCGHCNAAGVKQGAISLSGNTTFNPPVNVQTAACIEVAVNANVIYAGKLTGTASLTVGGLGTPVNGITQFTNTSNTYSGTMTVDGTTISQSTNNSLQYAKIVLANGGRIGTTTSSSQVIGSLASADPTTYWASGDFVSNTIRENGITTYAGRLLWNGGTNTTNIFLNGPATNELTMTGTGNTATVYPRNGARLILQGATFTGTQGQVRVQTGSTVSAGTSTTASVSHLFIDATSKLEVKAVGAGTSQMTVTTGFNPSAGWDVDVVDALAPGTYPILKYSGTATTNLPSLLVNNTGRAVTFAYNNAVNPKLLNMIVT